MSETLIIFLCFTKKEMRSYGIIAYKKQIELKEKPLLYLIEIEGHTCFSVFAGLRVLHLNLILAPWLFLGVPYLLVLVVVARQIQISDFLFFLQYSKRLLQKLQYITKVRKNNTTNYINHER